MTKINWRAIKNLSIGLLALVSITQLWDWYRQNTESLEVVIHRHAFSVLPLEVPTADNVLAGLDPKDFLGDRLYTEQERLLKRIMRQASIECRGQLQLQAMRMRPFQVYWLAEAKNNGKSSLEDVVLTLPGTKLVLVERAGSEGIVRESTEVIELGGLRPGETVSIQAWSVDSRASRVDPTITHKEGRGKTSLYVSVGWLGQFVHKFGPFWLPWVWP